MTNKPPQPQDEPPIDTPPVDKVDTGKGTSLIVRDVEVDGPPTRWADHEWAYPWQGVFLDSLSTLPVVSSAARSAGISRAWAYRVAGEDPDFKQAWAEAIAQGVEVVEQHVIRWATVGIMKRTTVTKRDAAGLVVEEIETVATDINPLLAMFVLKRHKPEYRERYGLEHSGPGGGPIQMTVQEKLNEAAERFDTHVIRLALTGGSGDSVGDGSP